MAEETIQPNSLNFQLATMAGELKAFAEHLKRQDVSLEKILDQTTKHNGRMGTAENQIENIETSMKLAAVERENIRKSQEQQAVNLASIRLILKRFSWTAAGVWASTLGVFWLVKAGYLVIQLPRGH